VVATTASKYINQVTFYLTSNPDVAKRFHIDPAAKRPALIFIKREEKFTLYGMCLHLKFRTFLHFSYVLLGCE